MYGALQILGALLVLAPFAAQQLGHVRPNSDAYLWPNVVGAALLAALAVRGGQWGFLLLEAVWALVAARTLIAKRWSRT
jgi:hypothetical protein